MRKLYPKTVTTPLSWSTSSASTTAWIEAQSIYMQRILSKLHTLFNNVRSLERILCIYMLCAFYPSMLCLDRKHIAYKLTVDAKKTIGDCPGWMKLTMISICVLWIKITDTQGNFMWYNMYRINEHWVYVKLSIYTYICIMFMVFHRNKRSTYNNVLYNVHSVHESDLIWWTAVSAVASIQE